MAGEEEDLVVFGEGTDGLDGGGAADGVHVGEGVVEEVFLDIWILVEGEADVVVGSVKNAETHGEV
jgi:hypothetical protein